MDSNCRKLGETPYRECRKQAANGRYFPGNRSA